MNTMLNCHNLRGLTDFRSTLRRRKKSRPSRGHCKWPCMQPTNTKYGFFISEKGSWRISLGPGCGSTVTYTLQRALFLLLPASISYLLSFSCFYPIFEHFLYNCYLGKCNYSFGSFIFIKILISIQAGASELIYKPQFLNSSNYYVSIRDVRTSTVFFPGSKTEETLTHS